MKLIPTIIQDSQSGQVLMLGYSNDESLKKTRTTKNVWFYSRSKKRLWMKGETSGNTLRVLKITKDCDNDAILIQAQPTGPTCHTKKISCFSQQQASNSIEALAVTISQRKKTMPKNSYTASLFRAGLKKICAKISEESAEVIQAATNESKQRLIEESVDLLYHLFVALKARTISLNQIYSEIIKRQNT